MTESASPARGARSSSSLISASLRLNSSSAWMDTANLLVFIFGGQQYPQLVKPAAGRGLHGALGDVEGGCSVSHRRVEHVAENEYLALDGGQAAQQPDEHVTAVDRLGERRDHRLRAGVGRHALHLRVARTLPPALPADVDQDRPAVGLGRLSRAVPAPERPQQRELQGVLGFLPGVEQHQGRPQEPGRRRPDEFGELRLPARRSTAYPSHDTFNAAGASEVPLTFSAGRAGPAGPAGLRRKPPYWGCCHWLSICLC